MILEDDYDAEFRYDRQPVGSLQGLAPDRVVALGSVSKTLAPALRIGWVFTPPRFRDAILTEKTLSCRGVPQLDQAALARLVETGRFDRHLRRVRDSYRQRRDALVAAVDEHVAGASITGLDAGHHALLQLPTGVDEGQVVVRARAEGVAATWTRRLPGHDRRRGVRRPAAARAGDRVRQRDHTSDPRRRSVCWAGSSPGADPLGSSARAAARRPRVESNHRPADEKYAPQGFSVIDGRSVSAGQRVSGRWRTFLNRPHCNRN